MLLKYCRLMGHLLMKFQRYRAVAPGVSIPAKHSIDAMNCIEFGPRIIVRQPVGCGDPSEARALLRAL